MAQAPVRTQGEPLSAEEIAAAQGAGSGAGAGNGGADSAQAQAKPTGIRPADSPMPDDEETSSRGEDAVKKAATSPKHAQTMSDVERLDATQWLLTADPDAEVARRSFWINVGTDEAVREVNWTVGALDSDTIDSIRKSVIAMAQPNRQMRRAGVETDFDTVEFHRRCVGIATIEPNLAEVAQQKNLSTADPYMGPARVLETHFRHKPGLVTQLFGEVMQLSGWDDADVSRATPDVVVARAVGN